VPRRRLPFALNATLLLAAGSSWAGNADSTLIGNQAALSGNAVTAVVSDAGAAWHNPAGLALLERSSMNLTGTALGFRSYVMPGSLEVVLPDGNRTFDLRHTEMVVGPSALVMVRKLTPDVTFALGLFLKAQGAPQQVWAQIDSSANGLVSDGSSYTYAQRMTVQQKGSAYHLGPSIGIRWTPTLSLGAALFLVYESSRTFNELFSDLSSDTGPLRTALMTQFSRSTSTFSGEAVFGMQWRLHPDWQIGAVVRTPILLLAYTFHTDALDSRTVEGGWLMPVQTSNDTSKGLLLSSLAPPRLHFGIARLLGWGFISLEGNFSPRKPTTDLLPGQQAVWNVRLGARRDLSETFSFGAGVFTDFTPGRTVDRFAEGRIDYYGATAGVEMRKPFLLTGGEQSKVVVSTCLALRYELGRGNASRLVLDTVTNTLLDSAPGRATVNELELYVGSGLSF
jgi:long-subunit fatty acid transport protein